jgi:cytochrome c-type biogenesis protein CcmH
MRRLMPDRSARLPLWARIGVPLAILAIALVIGSGALSAKPQTAAQRAVAIESVVRCPSCIDVNVLQSEETTAIAVRHQIQRQVAQGRTTSQIEQTLVSEYGQTILLEPPDTDGFAIIWILPIAVGVGAVACIGILFWRRSRQFAATRQAQMSDLS